MECRIRSLPEASWLMFERFPYYSPFLFTMRFLPALILFLVAHVCSAQTNVVFIISDDQAWGDYGFMGHEKIDTPHIDKLANESLVFTRGTTHVPLCRPSLATMATGLFPHQHMVTGNDPAKGEGKFDRRKVVDKFVKHPNIARDLSKEGYVTLQTGKWWEGSPVDDGGFTHAMTRGVGRGARHGDDGLKIGREGLKPITDFIQGRDGKPFFIWYAPFLPHTPHNPPKHLLDKYKERTDSIAVARYWACVEWFDETCGELMKELEDRDLLENTLIVYTTDNGWIQKTDTPQRYAPRSKQSPYEGGVRTPIMFYWKGKIEPLMDKTTLAGNIDLWPTTAALIKKKAPDNLPGINLMDKEAREARTTIFGEDFAHDMADIEDPTKSLEARYVIDGNYKLIAFTDGKSELYDLKNDPWEKKNLAAEQADKVAELTAKLDDWWKP